MDKIVMKGLQFFGYHGVLAEENRLGQKFVIDVILYLPLKQAGEGDALEASVSYAEAYTIVKEIVEKKQFKLIEALAEEIATKLLAVFTSIHKIDVTVKKPEAPVAGIYDYFAVEISRERNA